MGGNVFLFVVDFFVFVFWKEFVYEVGNIIDVGVDLGFD